MSSKDRAFSTQQNAKFLANASLRVEIVPTVII
jgi:hypothetical protein